MRIISIILLLIVVILGITFATLNSQMVTVNYYVGQSTIALAGLLVIAFVSGCLLAMLIGSLILFKLKIKNYRLKKRLQKTS